LHVRAPYLSVVDTSHNTQKRDGNSMDEKLKGNISDQSIWQRPCFMVLFAVAFNIA